MMNDVDATMASNGGEIDDEAADSSVPSSDTILTLPMGMSGGAIAQACRATGLEMINESRSWGKAELSMWLTGSYAFITAHASREIAAAGGAAPNAPVWPVPLLRDIDVRLIGRIMQSARTEILETLAAIARDGSASFCLRALIAGTVIRCEDVEGQPAWAPTSSATRLADRVLSLFAVDYLARPGDYETELFVCPECETVTFDASARARNSCHNHSGVPSKRAGSTGVSMSAPRGRVTLPYPPLGA